MINTNHEVYWINCDSNFSTKLFQWLHGIRFLQKWLLLSLLYLLRVHHCQNYKQAIFEFFLNNTNLTFLAFLYKTENRALNFQHNIASSGNQTHNTNLQEFRSLMPCPLCQFVMPCQFQTLIKSCSIESRKDTSPKRSVSKFCFSYRDRYWSLCEVWATSGL